ncbi:MAG: OmpH family outer membrane protein [Deltaproteobacteria bacterium]|nr:OmpH family outer membrane protein [Deltaproteobacteria bacterium]
MEKIVEKIGKTQGYTIILERRTLGLVYYKDSIDITDQVVAAYDKMKGSTK